jgi:hypothetical protein
MCIVKCCCSRQHFSPLPNKKIMRNIYSSLVAIAFFATTCAEAQSDYDFKRFTASFGVGPANRKGIVGSVEAQGVFNNNLVVSLYYHSVSADAKNEPADYQRGSFGTIFGKFADGYYPQNMNIFSATAGKFFRWDRNVWLTTEAGFSFVTGYEHEFTRQPVETDFWGFTSSNYKVTRENISGIGGVVKADITCGFASFAGVGFGVFANINSVQSVVGGELKLVLGWMNRERKLKKPMTTF